MNTKQVTVPMIWATNWLRAAVEAGPRTVPSTPLKPSP